MDSVEQPTSAARSRRNSRSRTGCRKCRENKVKCDEERPRCRRCIRLHRECDYRPRPRKKYARRAPVPQPPRSPSPENTSDTASARALSQSASRATADSRSSLHPKSQGGQDTGHLDIPSSSRDFTITARGLLDSVCSESANILSPLDHAAIHYFRFVLPTAVDSKPPEHSGPAIVWVLGQKDPMVMHSICALAGRKLCQREALFPHEAQERQSLAVQHYTAGLRLLHGALQVGNQSSDINCILATLWLMIAYEQQFGDGSGTGLNTHLQGAATVFQGRLCDIGAALAPGDSLHGFQEADTWRSEDILQSAISPLTCQLIVWIALIDGGAAINGLGGTFNQLLGQSLFGQNNDTAMARLKGFNALQRRSDLVNAEIWTTDYPPDQLVEDLQSSQLFCLEAESGQLRYLLSQLTAAGSCGPRQTEVGCAIYDVGIRYSELLRAANLLQLSELASPSQRRYVINIRFIVSFYHAVALVFFRAVNGTNALLDRQRVALREIMMLASKAHKDQGDEAMIRFAWPLFVVALESDDMIHRNWILERYDALASWGENFRRARDALRVVFREQGSSERRVDYAELVSRGDIARFVIG